MADSGLLSEEKQSLLQQKQPKLLTNIRLTPMFWASLAKHEVITIGDIGEIQKVGNATPQTQIAELLKHVINGTNERYRGFLGALAEAGQGHIMTQVLKDQIPGTLAPQEPSAQGHAVSTEGVQQVKPAKATKASTGESPLPWDRENPTVQMPYSESQHHDILNTLRVSLVEHLEDEGIWPHLRTLCVTKRVDEELITYNKSRPERVERLLIFIEKGPVWYFHSMLRAMALTGQSELFQGEGLDKTVYQQDCKPEHSGGGYLKILSKDVLRVIRDHCQSYRTSLMRRHIFDFVGDAGDDIIDISSCMIKVEPSMNSDFGDKTIPTNEILEQFGDKDPPRVIRLYGDPGDGKTSLMRYIPHLWSIEFPQLIDDHKYLTSKHPVWTTMVYLEARNITTTVDDAIIDALGCKEPDTPILMKHIREGQRVVLWLDAIDELRDKAAIEKVKKYVHTRKMKGGPTVLISARTHICPIDAKDIDRFLTLQGFTENQGVQYVEKYTNMYRLPDHAVNRYVGEHKEELLPVLGNPLRLYIFCGLALRGELKLEGNESFDIPKLFGTLARYLLRRSGSEVTEQQSIDFYRMCLWGLLKGEREFSEAYLAHFNVAQAFHIFLRRSDRRRSEDGELVPHYSFTHEMLYEFFSGCYFQTPIFQALSAIQQCSFLISICKNKYMRNMQKTVFQLLAQNWKANYKLIQMMVRSILALQDNDSGDETHLCGLVKLREDLEFFLEEELYSNRLEFRTTEASEVCKQISSAFNRRARDLKKNGVFGTMNENGTIQHVRDCLQICSAEQRHTLLENTIFQLLPCRYKEIWYLQTGATHWGDIEDNGGRPTVRTYLPRDAIELLRQYVTRYCRKVATPRSATIHLCDIIDYTLWGNELPDCSWSREWGALFNTLEELQVHQVHLRLYEPIPLTDLLMYLLDHAAALINKVIKVSLGRIQLGDLAELLPACHQAELTLHLELTSVVIPDDVPWLTAITQKESLCCLRTEYQKMLFFCSWVTENDEEYIF